MSHRKTTAQFIKEAEAIFKNRFSYELAEYKSAHEKIMIICKDHGPFLIRANDHLHGKSCNLCANLIRAKRASETKKKSVAMFIEQAISIHGERYDYSRTLYYGANKKVNIICGTHGEFLQIAHSHLDGSGCPSCSKSSISKIEKTWLDSLNIPQEYRQRNLKIDNNRFIVDAYDPDKNIVYEFYGDFWHGNIEKYPNDQINPLTKNSFGELYKKTKIRERKILNSGYILCTIWECEYKSGDSPTFIKNIERHI